LGIYSPILPNYTLSHFLFFSLQLESHSLCLSYFSYLISLLLYSFIFISFYFTSSFIIHSFFLILRILQRWWAFKPRPACLGLVLYIYIYILKGWMAKYTSNVANDVSSVRPDHSSHPMVAKKSGQCPFYSKTRLNFKSF
jgi:hypothetical protein